MIRDVGLMEEPRWLIVKELWCNGVRVVGEHEEEREHSKTLEIEYDSLCDMPEPHGEYEIWLELCGALSRARARIIAFQCVLIFTQPSSRCRKILANLYNIVIEQEWPEG